MFVDNDKARVARAEHGEEVARDWASMAALKGRQAQED